MEKLYIVNKNKTRSWLWLRSWTSSKGPMQTLMYSVPSMQQQATSNPHLCQRLLDPHRQVWVSLLWGHCSFLLGPGAHRVVFVPSKSLFPQSCVNSSSSMVGLMATSSSRAYVTPRSTAPRAPASAAVHCWPIPPQEILKHSSDSETQFLPLTALNAQTLD